MISAQGTKGITLVEVLLLNLILVHCFIWWYATLSIYGPSVYSLIVFPTLWNSVYNAILFTVLSNSVLYVWSAIVFRF
jgi:hypothetical protein